MDESLHERGRPLRHRGGSPRVPFRATLRPTSVLAGAAVLAAAAGCGDGAGVRITGPVPAAGTRTLLSSEGRSPDVDGDAVVWRVPRADDAPESFRILDLATGLETGFDPGDRGGDPFIRDGRIAWVAQPPEGAETPGTAGRVLDLATGSVLELDRFGSLTNPDLSRNRIAFREQRLGFSRLQVYDFRTAEWSPFGREDEVRASPSVDGEHLAWIQFRSADVGPDEPATVESDVWLRELDGPVVRPVAAEPGDETAPHLGDGRLVWMARERGGDWDLWLLEIAPGEEASTETVRLTDHPANQTLPRIDGDRIAYLDDRSGSPDVFVHDLRTGRTLRVTEGGVGARSPRISGRRVVWWVPSAADEERGEVWLFELDDGG